MTTMHRITTSWRPLLAFLLLGGLAACDRDTTPDSPPATAAAAEPAGEQPAAAEAPASEALATQPVTIVGRNYCLGCALKKGEGAAAQCSDYGHRHGLLVESASGADGQSLGTLSGQTLHYLDNDRSASLLEGGDLHEQRVEVKGRLFAPERTLEVSDIEVL